MGEDSRLCGKTFQLYVLKSLLPQDVGKSVHKSEWGCSGGARVLQKCTGKCRGLSADRALKSMLRFLIVKFPMDFGSTRDMLGGSRCPWLPRLKCYPPGGYPGPPCSDSGGVLGQAPWSPRTVRYRGPCSQEKAGT